jgi:5-methylcytosine-specific restriction endonuclease McrA
MSRTREASRRAAVFARDHGICARCGRDTVAEGIGWEADHVRPVADGGGQCPLDQLRTLCRYPCHEIVTAEWRRQRSGRGRREAAYRRLVNGWWQRD